MINQKLTTENRSNSNGKLNGHHSKSSRKMGEEKGLESSQLMKLFEEELKDIYWAEKALTKVIPKMISNATSEKLILALSDHLDETHQQVGRLAEVFSIIDRKPVANKSEAMEGLINEAAGIIEECEPGAMRDAGIISAEQKVEHYEIASYGTLCQFAETLHFDEAAALLQRTLEEEKAVDKKLTEVAVAAVFIKNTQE